MSEYCSRTVYRQKNKERIQSYTNIIQAQLISSRQIQVYMSIGYLNSLHFNDYNC